MEPTTSPPTLPSNGNISSAKTSTASQPSVSRTPSLSPRLSTLEIGILACYPITVLLGIISNHPKDSYFARKDNFINVFFLKYSWAWTSLVFFWHLSRVPNKVRPIARYATATIWWYLVTQWCFGPPIMDKVFRGTGGICQLASQNEEFPNVFTAAMCRSSGGAWSGGHDLSGHIFLLTHASLFLWWEVLPLLSQPNFHEDIATKANIGMLFLWWFSLLNTGIYFHTILEKVTGLVAGLIGWYLTDVLTTYGLDLAGI